MGGKFLQGMEQVNLKGFRRKEADMIANIDPAAATGTATQQNVLITKEIHNSYNQFLFHSFLSALHVSNESVRSSSAAQRNILYYTVWYNRYNSAIRRV